MYVIGDNPKVRRYIHSPQIMMVHRTRNYGSATTIQGTSKGLVLLCVSTFPSSAERPEPTSTVHTSRYMGTYLLLTPSQLPQRSHFLPLPLPASALW
jgi:hypothetical protein